jgi:hypothetical protein
MQKRPQGFGKDDLVFKNGALDFVHHLHRQERTERSSQQANPEHVT